MKLSDFFDVKIRDVILLSELPEKIEVKFNDELYRKLQQEQEHYTKEIAFLGTARKHPDKIVIKFEYLPEQERYPAYVKVLEYNPKYNAVFHLHPRGVQQFSAVDYEYLNQNYDYSVMVDVSGKGQICIRDSENDRFYVAPFEFKFEKSG